MTWDELIKKHEEELEAFAKAYNESKAQMVKDEIEIMKACGGESKIPDTLKDKIERDRQAWREKWGVDGEKSKALQESQKKEMERFFERQNVLLQMQQATQKSKTHEKERD